MGRQAQPLFPCGPCHSPLEKQSGAEGVEMYTHCVHNTERGRIDLRWLCVHTHCFEVNLNDIHHPITHSNLHQQESLHTMGSLKCSWTP